MTSLVDQFLPRAYTADNLAMHFVVEINACNHGYEKDGNTYHKGWERSYRIYMHYIVSSYRNVWCALSDSPLLSDVPLDTFKNTSNHDTCWRSDGFRDIFNAYFNAYKMCYSHIPDEHRPAPIASNTRITLNSMLRKQVHFVRFSMKRSDNYHYGLTEVRPVAFNFSVED